MIKAVCIYKPRADIICPLGEFHPDVEGRDCTPSRLNKTAGPIIIIIYLSIYYLPYNYINQSSTSYAINPM